MQKRSNKKNVQQESKIAKPMSRNICHAKLKLKRNIWIENPILFNIKKEMNINNMNKKIEPYI